MPGPMSMEAALDEERRGVLELLEGTSANRAHRGSTGSGGVRASSPFSNPRSPVRSMLDVDDPTPRHASIAGTTAAGTSLPRPAPIRSMLDVDYTPISRSAQTSPTELQHNPRSLNTTIHPRSKSDAAPRIPDFGPRGGLPEWGTRGDKTSEYQFSGYLPSNAGGPVVPKRNTLAGKKASITPSASALEAVKAELAAYNSRQDRGRHKSIASTGIGLGSSKSRSPANRQGLRSNSPATFNSTPSNLVPNPNQFALDSGEIVDMSSAYRRLSDAHLAMSGGSLSTLSGKGRRRTDSGDAVAGQRLEKDYYGDEDEEVVESSEDERHSSDDEGRGRKKGSRLDNAANADNSSAGSGRIPLSLLAAAEEERIQIAQKVPVHKVRSLLEPEITVTGPGGDRMKPTRSGIHPTNAFDQDAPSGINTPVDSDTEADIGDIRRAQKLGVIMTPIMSNVSTSRCVRTIYRGDFAKMQREAEDDQRRVRKYLVATDLSDEAAHALEWTIGTVLRDGDTLLAIYCVDEETGVQRPEDSADSPFQHAQAATIAATTNNPQPSHLPIAAHIANSPLSGGTRSANASPMGRRSRAEQERYNAIEDITQRVSKLLRKTRLQVRVVIEVIHCKSPKHLITEVIDYIEPTLVILGSRGRSALKGVILGSFSNYLVTKSSVPVMVARKRLRKHGKYKRPSIRLANNLTNVSGKSLVNAKID